ncbi:MAG: ATP-binding protein [Proteobacteria bacterium]|nr:ATP-binding protein [Pseudomonadota bacterium]
MQEIRRDIYLKRLIQRIGNGQIKVITGIRRCGKSYLLDPIFKNHLLSTGVPDDHIVKIELDRLRNRQYHHDPSGFEDFILSQVKDNARHYILLDEIQLVDDFELILNGLLYEKNLDVYVTGSNSKFLSSDIITAFRGRGDQIHVSPLSFAECCSIRDAHPLSCLNDYMTYGGMPLVQSYVNDSDKAVYLKELFSQTYFVDIIERNQIQRTDVLDSLVNILASSVGSLTNPQKIYDTFKSNGTKELSINTINSHLAHLEDAFIVRKALRYDVKGRKYINTPQKYYFTDLGLRNARLNFRQQEETHLMENAIYNELITRGYNVDIGVVELREKGRRQQTEVDFVCNEGSSRYYIQSALSLDTSEKTNQESRPLRHIDDNFRKIIVVKDVIKPWHTDYGILVMGIVDFLLDPNSLNR